MFTGIIKGQSKVDVLKKSQTDLTIAIDLSVLNEKINIGDSIAVDGVCLTVTTLKNNIATFDLMHETLNRTTFKHIENGYIANLEPSLTLSSKLDGHLVYGDVDAEGKIINIETIGDSKTYTFSYPKEFAKYMIDKGRITIDGASLTVINSTEDGIFSVSLIPHSLRELNIANKTIGDSINLEFDVYAKMVFKQRRFHD